MSMPAHAVRVRQPATKLAQLLVVFRPEHEMPVVGHQHESHNAHGTLVLHFGQHTDKGIVVAGFLQQGQAGYGTVEDVVDDATRGLPSSAGHDAMVKHLLVSVK